MIEPVEHVLFHSDILDFLFTNDVLLVKHFHGILLLRGLVSCQVDLEEAKEKEYEKKIKKKDEEE